MKSGSIIQLIKSHPKKTLLISLLLGMLIAYKKRNTILHFTFNQVLSRMNQKFMLQMSEQVSNVEKYNRKLAELQTITEEYYQNQFQRKQLVNIFKASLNIEILRASIKNLDKSLPNYTSLRSTKYSEMNAQLLIFQVSTIALFKTLDTLKFLSSIVYAHYKTQLYALLDKDETHIQELLQWLCNYICTNLYQEVENYTIQRITNNPSFAYSAQIEHHEYFRTIIELIQNAPFAFNRQLAESCANYQIQQKFNQLQMNIHNLEGADSLKQGIAKALPLCNAMMNQFLDLAESPSIKSLQYFSCKFNIRKLWNRYQLLQEKTGSKQVQILFTHLTNVHKIINEEFLAMSAEVVNEQFYQKKIKQAIQASSNEENCSEKSLGYIYRVNEEFIQNQKLNQTIFQLSRKVMFKEDFDQNEDIDSTQSTSFSDFLLQIGQ